MHARVLRRSTWIVLAFGWLLAHSAAAQQGNPLTRFLPRPQHITVSASATPAAVTRPTRVTLTVEVTPNPGIHVYAPGAKGYLPIALTVSPIARTALGKTVYPKSELVLFANERVAVYQKPFRLARTLTIGEAVKPGTLTVAGTVDYQACDDNVCFAPESIPVSWSVAVR